MEDYDGNAPRAGEWIDEQSECPDGAPEYILASEHAALIREAEERGMERAACLVEQRAADYDAEHGIYDYSTGVTEYPGTGDESMEEWESIAAAIRAAKATP